MKQLFTILLTFFLFTSVFSQEKERFLGFNFTPGLSDFYDSNMEFFSSDLDYRHEAALSHGFDLSYSFQNNSFAYGATFGLTILRNKLFLNVDSSYVENSVQYVGLKYSSVHNQYLLHFSPFIRWNFIHQGKFAMFIELQPGVFNRTLSVYNSVFDYQAIYEDYNSSTSEWYSEPYKPVSFSLTGKTGLQYILNDKYSLNFAVYYCNYLTSFIKSSFLGPGNVYYRYGIETGVKLKLN